MSTRFVFGISWKQETAQDKIETNEKEFKLFEAPVLFKISDKSLAQEHVISARQVEEISDNEFNKYHEVNNLKY